LSSAEPREWECNGVERSTRIVNSHGKSVVEEELEVSLWRLTAYSYTAKEMWEDRGIDGVMNEAETG
jgi:hypothetical protein